MIAYCYTLCYEPERKEINFYRHFSERIESIDEIVTYYIMFGRGYNVAASGFTQSVPPIWPYHAVVGDGFNLGFSCFFTRYTSNNKTVLDYMWLLILSFVQRIIGV